MRKEKATRNLAAMAMAVAMVVAAGCGATGEAPVAYYEAPAIEVVATRAPTLSYEAPAIEVVAKAPARQESLAW
jgi:hypothetical protein